jgi:UDP-glucose:(heptosyl)LPS alpha-1,3-glucosyltransferase
MRIALLIDQFDHLGGGQEQWTVAFARFLAAQNHEVHVVAFGQSAHGIAATMHLLQPETGMLRRARAVATAVAGLAADVVHDSGIAWCADVFHPHTGSSLLAQERLVATHSPLMRVRAAISPVSMARRRQMWWRERCQVRRARRIVAVSQLVRGHLARQHGLREDHFTLIRNGVDTARFAPGRLAPLRAVLRQVLGVGDGVLFAVSAHNMHLKGVDTAMRALAMLRAAKEDVWLAVAGCVPGPFWLQMTERLGVRDRVCFLGPVNGMEQVYAAADVLVHPTRWDACSLSTIEAGASGLPTITTTMNGAAELIVDGRTGFILADPEDHAALAAYMRILLDGGVRRQMGLAAREAAAGHDVWHNFRAVEKALEEAALCQAVSVP